MKRNPANFVKSVDQAVPVGIRLLPAVCCAFELRSFAYNRTTRTHRRKNQNEHTLLAQRQRCVPPLTSSRPKTQAHMRQPFDASL